MAFPAVIVTPDSALDSFFGERDAGSAQTRRLRALVENWAGRQPTLVLVTHQVNITASTGMSAAEGEVVVLLPKPGGFEVAGRIAPD